MPIGLLPILVTNEDSGGMHWTVRAFRLRKLRLRDLPNRVRFSIEWRILLHVAQGAGFRDVMLLTAANLITVHGTWQGVAWFSAARRERTGAPSGGHPGLSLVASCRPEDQAGTAC